MPKNKKFNLTQLLNSNAEAGEAGQEKPRRAPLKVVSLSVHDLVPSQDNFYSVDDIAGLKTSVEIFGIKQNLTVKPSDGGKYEIIAGHRRRLACLELVNEGKSEFEYVPCGIETGNDEIKERILLIMSNSTTRTLSDFEKMKQAEALREYCEAWKKRDNLPGRVRDMVAEIMQESVTQIARMNAIANNLSPEFQAEFQVGRVGISAAVELAALSPEKQAEAFNDYTETGGMSVKSAKALKDESAPPHTSEPAADPPEETPDPWVEKHKADMAAMGREIENMINEDETRDCPPQYCGNCARDACRHECEADAPPEAKDFADMSAEEKGAAAVEFLEGIRFKVFAPGADTRIFDFIVETLEQMKNRP